MGSLKSPCTTLKCLVFEKIAYFFAFWRQTDRQTDKQMDSSDALSRSRCRERRLNNRSTLLKEITAKFNENGNRAVSVQRVLFKEGYHRRVVRKVIGIRKLNKRNRVEWCREKRYLSIDGY